MIITVVIIIMNIIVIINLLIYVIIIAMILMDIWAHFIIMHLALSQHSQKY